MVTALAVVAVAMGCRHSLSCSSGGGSENGGDGAALGLSLSFPSLPLLSFPFRSFVLRRFALLSFVPSRLVSSRPVYVRFFAFRFDSFYFCERLFLPPPPPPSASPLCVAVMSDR